MAPFRIQGAGLDSILAEPRFRVFAIWYLSDPMHIGSQMRLGLAIRPKIHSPFDSILPTIYVGPGPADPGEPDAPPSEATNEK